MRVDCAVVGGGVTGLAVARRLAEHRPQWRIAVVERERVGFGSSGRNSGFVGDIAHRNPKLSAEQTLPIKRIARAGCDALRELVRQHGIECQWAELGRLHVAVEPGTQKHLEDLVGLLAQFDEPHEPKDAAQLASILGTEYYRAGVHIKGTVLLQPAALMRGLAAALPENVDLYEETPVLGIDRGAPVAVRTASGTVTADRLYMAANGYSPTLGVLKRRIFPLHTFASLTRTLADGEVGGDRQWGVVSENRMGSTLRRTPDQRIVIRNCVRYGGPGSLAKVRAMHGRTLQLRFPALKQDDLEYTWGGVLGMTLNQGNFFGRLADNTWAAAGYSGTGMAMGTAFGRMLADASLDVDSELLADVRTIPKASWIPPEPFLGLGVRAMTGFLQSRAGAER